MIRVLAIAIVLLLSACDSRLDREVQALVEAKDRWLQSGLNESYSFEYSRTCYCLYNNKPFQVTVLSGQVVDIQPLGEFEEAVPRYIDESNPTIRALFEQILELIEDSMRNGTRLTVEYDEELGFPSTIIWTDEKLMDGGFRINVKAVAAH